MIPFVVDENTNYNSVFKTFQLFKILVIDFAAYVLNLNSYLEPSILCTRTIGL
jgi:hypothetical protein